MKRPATKIVVAAMIVGVAIIGLAGARVVLRRAPVGAMNEDVPCGGDFVRHGNRCCPTASGTDLPAGQCAPGPPAGRACPGPLVATDRGCDAPEPSIVLVPRTTVTIGPSDWEAEGRVRPRILHTEPFAIDRFEMSLGRMRCATCPDAAADPARAASGVTLAEARAVCKERGGRLPTEDEWIVAAAGERPRRYPWGDTGAVCRRAAWGLVAGPCGNGATGPDTVGAHPDGASPLGIEDLAGNVAEWVEAAPGDGGDGPASGIGVVRGGSYATDLATDLRTWARREVPLAARDATIGFRCAYDATTPSEGGPTTPNAP